MSATPGPYELQRSEQIAEQLIRPTGIVDPQVDDPPDRGPDRRPHRPDPRARREGRAGARHDADQEDGRGPGRLPARDGRQGLVPALARSTRSSGSQILRDLRLGVYDVLVGINLLREGIDLPEVTLVAILDADKEGFLRSAWSLIQVSGRAARNIGGEVVMYADRITESMQVAIDETDAPAGDPGANTTRSTASCRRRSSRASATSTTACARWPRARSSTLGAAGRVTRAVQMSRDEIEKLVGQMEAEMRAAARELEFERAASLRDEIQQIRLRVLEEDASVIVAAPRKRAREAKSEKQASAKPSERVAAMNSGNVAAAARSPRTRRRSRGHVRHGPAGRRGADPRTSTASRSRTCSTRARPRTGCPASATSTTTTPGWMARWLDRQTWDRTVTPEHPPADRDPRPEATRPLITLGGVDATGPWCPVHSHAGSGTASDRRIRPRARQISARVASSVRPSCEAISRVR